MAIFEFSSSNGYSSFNLSYECRSIRIREIEDGNQSQSSYEVELSRRYDFPSDICEELGFGVFKNEVFEVLDFCVTNFQGKKYSRI